MFNPIVDYIKAEMVCELSNRNIEILNVFDALLKALSSEFLYFAAVMPL